MNGVPGVAGPVRSDGQENTCKATVTVMGGFFAGLLTGIVLAGVYTLLYAPKSGQETRDLLKNEVNETQKMLQDWSFDVRERLNKLSQIIRFCSSKEEQTTSEDRQKEYQQS